MAVTKPARDRRGAMGGGLPGAARPRGARGDHARERSVEATLERLAGARAEGDRSQPWWRSGAIAAFRSAIANHLLEFGAEAAQ
jgi:uroporphyrin-III C-methyltransferase